MQLSAINYNKAPIDVTDQATTDYLTFSSVFMISAFLQPAKYLVFWTWLPALLYFGAFPEDLVDSSGYALPGYGEALARTRDMLKMLVLDYEPFLGNPDGDSLIIEDGDIINMIINVLISWFLTDTFDYMFGALPFACQFIWTAINLIGMKGSDLDYSSASSAEYMVGRLNLAFGEDEDKESSFYTP